MFFMLPTDIAASVSGLIGNKLLSIYQRPLCVLREKIELDDETGEIIKHEYSGSMRAVGVDSFKEYVDSVGIGWVEGHENAAGLGVQVTEFNDFKAAIEEVLQNVEFRVDVEADIELRPEQINENLIRQLNAMNKISGNGFKPITVMVTTDDYEVSFMTQGKHSKFIDNETGLLLVSWNDTTWRDAPKDKVLCGVGTVSKVRYGRNNYLQLTMNDYDFTQQND
jgi:single-stranded DNA-specific DHH superfamily exonuclease